MKKIEGSAIRVLHLVAGAENGGAETFCADAIKALAEAGMTQYVLSRNHKHFINTWAEAKVSYGTLSFSRLTRPFDQRVIRNAVADFRPDLIHCWMSRAASFVPPDMPVPVLGWFGGYYSLRNYRHCDFYMGVTKDIVRHIIEHTGKPYRSFLVHTFGTLEKKPPVAKAALGVPDGAKTVLLLSRMHRKKGIDTLLEAVREVPGAYFLLAGDGPDMGRYKKQAALLNIEERVRFLRWRDDRSALLDIADVCVLPSRYEPFGTVIAEAWFAGVPLVATKAAGARQYVRHGENGLLSEIDDVQGLAENLRMALGDSELCGKLIEGGRASCAGLFDKAAVTRAMILAYRAMLATGKRRPWYADDDENEAGGFLQREIADILAAFPGAKNVERVAAAYALQYEDSTIALDAAQIQAQGLYNFCKGHAALPKIEILSESEINILVGNSKNDMWNRFAA